MAIEVEGSAMPTRCVRIENRVVDDEILSIDGTTVLPFPGAPKFEDADGDGELDEENLESVSGGTVLLGPIIIGFTVLAGCAIYNAIRKGRK